MAMRWTFLLIKGRMAMQAKGEEIDARGLLVMAGGVDAHSHIAGKEVNTGRIYEAR